MTIVNSETFEMSKSTKYKNISKTIFSSLLFSFLTQENKEWKLAILLMCEQQPSFSLLDVSIKIKVNKTWIKIFDKL